MGLPCEVVVSVVSEAEDESSRDSKRDVLAKLGRIGAVCQDNALHDRAWKARGQNEWEVSNGLQSID